MIVFPIVYAGLFVDSSVNLHCIGFHGCDLDAANELADKIVASHDNDLQDCLWMCDIRDLTILATFFGEHREQFKHELKGKTL